MYIFQRLISETCTLHTSLLSDASARWREMNGDTVKLVTGTDQHGMKYSTPLPKKIYQYSNTVIVWLVNTMWVICSRYFQSLKDSN